MCSRYQEVTTNRHLNEARDDGVCGWQRHELDLMQKNLHLAPDRWPHQHLVTQFLQVGCSSWRSAYSVIALMAIYYQDLIPYNLIPCSLYLCFWIALHCIALRCVVLLTAGNTHTHPFNGPFSGTTQVSRYQKSKTNLDFTEATDSEWQWHQLGYMQVCTLLQTDNHASTPPFCFLQVGCPSCRPTNSVKALKALLTVISSLFVFQFECWLYFQHSLQVLLLCMVAMQVFQYTFDLSYTAVRSSQTGPLFCCVLLLLFFYPR